MNDRTSRHRWAAWAAVLGAAATAVPAAAAEHFVPGVTDFGVRSAYVQHEAFTPGVTDFPQRPADVGPAAAPTVRVSAADRFDWSDAGVGAGAAVVAAVAAAAAAVAVSRTRRVRHG